MPIFSYLAISEPGSFQQLCADLKAMDYCEIVLPKNKEIAVLVTDTPDEETEKRLQSNLKSLKSLQSLSMTFGHVDENQKNKEAIT